MASSLPTHFHLVSTPSALQLAAEGAVLERGEERVELGKRRPLRGLEPTYSRYSAGEFSLQRDRRNWDRRTEISFVLMLNWTVDLREAARNSERPPGVMKRLRINLDIC